MTLENRDLSKEGSWRERKKSDPEDKTINRAQSKYVAKYLEEVLSAKQFTEKYCPEWKPKDLLYHRQKGYTPAECIVRYNANHTPIHIPDVEYTWRDLRLATLVSPTRKVKREKAKRDRKENFIKRKLII